MTEFGYVNAKNAAKRPWYTHPKDKRDDNLQARCFQAFANAWKGEKNLVRMFVWKTSDLKMGAIDADPIGRPAEKVLKKWFDVRATGSF